MEAIKVSTLNDFCWVYVTRDQAGDRQLHIALATDLPQLLRDSTGRAIVYYRQFHNTLDGIAHKLLLTNVDNDTLRNMLREANPAMRDLRTDFGYSPVQPESNGGKGGDG